MSSLTYLDLVDQCDVLPYPNTAHHKSFLSAYFTLVWKETPIGYMLKSVVDQLSTLPSEIQEKIQLNIEHDKLRLSLFQSLTTYSERTAAAAVLCDHWRTHKTFRVLAGWRSELYPVYGPNHELLWSFERSASVLFGTVSYGVHLTAYTKDDTSPHGIKIWVPRRAAQKQTFGGMLDNSVAGGMATGEVPLECVLREAEEEAGLRGEMVRDRLQECGTVRYVYIRDARAGGEVGLVQPECQFIYDLELPRDVLPSPNDGEVEEFYLWELPKVQAALRRGEFKPNCALVMLDFLIRWGILNQENEKDFSEIKRRIHRELEFPGPHGNFEFKQPS
ncbi:hypothetical protein K3495_g2178 [Podosphaera aphanis]|nr:hypothetical protein K3495_g2178 [Podosphaera aphanis]